MQEGTTDPAEYTKPTLTKLGLLRNLTRFSDPCWGDQQTGDCQGNN